MEPGNAPPTLALLGCGIFARDAYLGILQAMTSHITLRYIWSRSQEACERMHAHVTGWAPQAEALWGPQGLDKILADPAVHCCAVVLPIQAQPAVVARALRAGKHVLQEKPVGATVEQGLETLATWRGLAKPPIWAVAENFRFEPAMHFARRQVAALGGTRLVLVDIEVPMRRANKYYTSAWRRDPSLKGGFITDCGVHFVAALRLVTGREVVSIAASATHRDAGLPPPDTLTANLVLDDGCSGVLAISYAASASKMSWRVVCEGGTVEVTRGAQDGVQGYLVIWGAPEQRSFFPFGGIEGELLAFASDVRAAVSKGGQVAAPNSWSSPVEALRDLAVIEAALTQGQGNGAAPRHIPANGGPGS